MYDEKTPQLRGPMRADPGDFESIIELLDECFPRDKELGGMLPRWPHCFRRGHSLIIKDGPSVVSHVGCIDQNVMIGNATIRVAGISGVATRPSYRNRGLMTSLLLYSVKHMKEEGYALSDLGGDRQRYGRFGWEAAGRVWQFTINRRSLATQKKPEGFEAARYAGTPDELHCTLRLHNRQRTGLQRDAELHRILLNRLGKETWIVRKEEVIDSYAVVERQGKWVRIDEFGGTPNGIHALLAHLIETTGSDSVSMPLPWNHPLHQKLFSLSSGWHVSCLRMIKILDLCKTLRSFSHQLASRYRRIGLGGSRKVVLGIEGDLAKVELDFSEAELSAEPTDKQKGAIILSERQMVRFLFGPGSASITGHLPPKAGFLDALLPLDFHLWWNEHV